MKLAYRIIKSCVIVLVLLSHSKQLPTIIPVTGTLGGSSVNNSTNLSYSNNSLRSPGKSYMTTNTVSEIYANNLFDFSVGQQPASQPDYVSSTPGVVTQFSLATKYGSIGLIAHNYLSGKSFNNLQKNKDLVVLYEDGSLEKYTVVEIRQYQALSPSNLNSSFVNLSNPRQMLSVEEVFFETYGVKDSLILQTCIEKNNQKYWGRLFIIAEKKAKQYPVSFNLYRSGDYN